MVKTVIYPKQDELYHKAVADQDWYLANLLYIPPIYKSWRQIESEMKTEQLIADFEYEMDRIKNTPNDMLKFELEEKYNNKLNGRK